MSAEPTIGLNSAEIEALMMIASEPLSVSLETAEGRIAYVVLRALVQKHLASMFKVGDHAYSFLISGSGKAALAA